MKQSLSELQRRLERATQERHIGFLDDDDSYQVRCLSLEDEISTYKKYAEQLKAANEATAVNAAKQREYQESLEKRILELENEKLDFAHELAVLRRKRADVEDSMALRAVARYKLEIPREVTPVWVAPEAPAVETVVAAPVPSTPVAEYQDVCVNFEAVSKAESVGRLHGPSPTSMPIMESPVVAVAVETLSKIGRSEPHMASARPPVWVAPSSSRTRLLAPVVSSSSLRGASTPGAGSPPSRVMNGGSFSPFSRPPSRGAASPTIPVSSGAVSPAVRVSSPPLRAFPAQRNSGDASPKYQSSVACYPSSILRHGAWAPNKLLGGCRRARNSSVPVLAQRCQSACSRILHPTLTSGPVVVFLPHAVFFLFVFRNRLRHCLPVNGSLSGPSR